MIFIRLLITIHQWTNVWNWKPGDIIKLRVLALLRIAISSFTTLHPFVVKE